MTLRVTPASHLLLDDRPLILFPALASAIGLEEAVIVQQLHYRLHESRQIRADRKWICRTLEQLQHDEFPFWSERTIHRYLRKLEAAGVVLVDHFNLSNIDQTKWYSVDYDALVRYAEDGASHKEQAHLDKLSKSGRSRQVGDLEVDNLSTSVSVNPISPTCLDVKEENTLIKNGAAETENGGGGGREYFATELEALGLWKGQVRIALRLMPGFDQQALECCRVYLATSTADVPAAALYSHFLSKGEVPPLPKPKASPNGQPTLPADATPEQLVAHYEALDANYRRRT